TWTPAMGTIVVSSNVIVPAGLTLTVEGGSTIYLTNLASVIARGGGKISLTGTRAQPIRFLPFNAPNVWGEIAAEGSGSMLTLQHVEISGGAVKWRTGAAGLMEDCYVHNYKSGSIPIAGCTSASSLAVRRCHFSVYHETLWQSTLITVEDCLFENANNPSSDALDFDAAPPGSVIRRCTFRHGPESNTDAIDLGSGSIGTVVEDCLMFDFPFDKGVSIGEASFGIVIRNCLVYGCDSGVAVKDTCTATLYNCTFVDNDFGFRAYNKANPSSPTGGGHITNSYDNILWGNDATISLLNASTAVADHSDLSNTNWPGTGNIDADPLFVNPTGRDYRLQPGSPAIGSGRDGANIGAHFPVGAPMALSHPRFERFQLSGSTITFEFWVDSEKSYRLESSSNIATGWTTEASFTPTALPRLVEHQLSVPVGPQQFYRLVVP
ncbi:MAG TPA: right-handed parallel beta-helix repeat-containing protein, partial [Verrucomicrobiae bacterium]|nr:right-handed parallel beta-helix repeat-containing protein [Verrucomicrobiae bacterium]